jgi:hypothetical protein
MKKIEEALIHSLVRASPTSLLAHTCRSLHIPRGVLPLPGHFRVATLPVEGGAIAGGGRGRGTGDAGRAAAGGRDRCTSDGGRRSRGSRLRCDRCPVHARQGAAARSGEAGDVPAQDLRNHAAAAMVRLPREGRRHHHWRPDVLGEAGKGPPPPSV